MEIKKRERERERERESEDFLQKEYPRITAWK